MSKKRVIWRRKPAPTWRSPASTRPSGLQPSGATATVLGAVAIVLRRGSSEISISPDRHGSGATRIEAELSIKQRRENRSEEHTSELQSLRHLVCRLLLEKKN